MAQIFTYSGKLSLRQCCFSEVRNQKETAFLGIQIASFPRPWMSTYWQPLKRHFLNTAPFHWKIWQKLVQFEDPGICIAWPKKVKCQFWLVFLALAVFLGSSLSSLLQESLSLRLSRSHWHCLQDLRTAWGLEFYGKQTKPLEKYGLHAKFSEQQLAFAGKQWWGLPSFSEGTQLPHLNFGSSFFFWSCCGLGFKQGQRSSSRADNMWR